MNNRFRNYRKAFDSMIPWYNTEFDKKIQETSSNIPRKVWIEKENGIYYFIYDSEYLISALIPFECSNMETMKTFKRKADRKLSFNEEKVE